MPFDGTGVFTPVYNWETDQANSIDVRADRMDVQDADIATGLSNCITKDGQQVLTANIPFAGYKITGLGVGSASTDSVNFGQVFTAPSFSGGITVAGGVTVSSGAVAMTSATSVTVPTATAGDNSNKAASTAFAVGLAFAAALPAQATHADNFVTTDGATASWTPNLKATVVRFKDGTDATKLLAFSLSGLTTLTTRTVTIPDKNGTMAMTSDLPATASTAKAWLMCDAAGNINSSFGVGSITDGGVGLLTVTFSVAMASANYAALASFDNATPNLWASVTSKLAASCAFRCFSSGSVNADPSNWNCLFFGA